MMKKNFDKGLDVMGMGIGEYIRFMERTGKCNMKSLIRMMHIKFKDGMMLPPKLYRLLDGPFKGALFMSTAPDVELMQRYQYFTVEFLDPKLKGITTSSLITYDRRVISLETKWRKLL